MNVERKRLLEKEGVKNLWKRWGPYLSERQWGTVREDYSPEGRAWDFSTHSLARSKAYRWGEEGIAGICDNKQRLCFAPSFWNERDYILKERFFGLNGNEGNHGEDVKEYYCYLDNTPTHSWMRMLYKYPQEQFPYTQIREENSRRGKEKPEFELLDTGIFNENRYFDIFIEYAKSAAEDILIKITAFNRYSKTAPLHIIPQLWFRNTWSWGLADNQLRVHNKDKPQLRAIDSTSIEIKHDSLGQMFLYADGTGELLFCENESNEEKCFNLVRGSGYRKDGINDRIVTGALNMVNPQHFGTKAGVWNKSQVSPEQPMIVKLRLSRNQDPEPFKNFDQIFSTRQKEADLFYEYIQHDILDPDVKMVQRQALAGMLWSKQFYYFDVRQWIEGDPGQPLPPNQRKFGRNRDWSHLNNADIISMPDKWEYPWYAAWDLAFHCLPLAMIDSAFAKEQLVLMTREWYMHPNGQLPAYEWNFGDVNPPVHAWATWRVFQIDRKERGDRGDIAFLEKVFHKLLLNFTWWVNRKDEGGRNIFQGGFLGLDNIGVFDRSSPLPTGGYILQSDGTSWMAMYSLNLLRISLELAKHNPVYEDIASKFFEHFLHIAEAMTNMANEGIGLWDDEDKFYYDVLHLPDERHIIMKVRSMVGLIPLFAVETIEPELMAQLPGFAARLEWLLEDRPDLSALVSNWCEVGRGERRLLSLLRGHRMKRLLSRMLDETEFLSDYGVRALSKYHQNHPYVFNCEGKSVTVGYEPGESNSGLFGGNSNWRGPIWFPVNYLLIESLQKFHHYYGDEFKIECPSGSKKFLTILEVADELSRRLTRIFLRDENGCRPVFGDNSKLQKDPHFRDYPLFYEYFHGDSGRGLGASHQTGWTGLIAKLLMPRRDPSLLTVRMPAYKF